MAIFSNIKAVILGAGLCLAPLGATANAFELDTFAMYDIAANGYSKPVCKDNITCSPWFAAYQPSRQVYTVPMQKLAYASGIDRSVYTGSVRKTKTGIDHGIFGSTAIAFSGLASKSQWMRVKGEQAVGLQRKCSAQRCSPSERSLSRLVSGLQGETFANKLRAVNRAVNTSIAYVSDRQLYSRFDYWASAEQTASIGKGDCEDYAILKMAILKELGVPTKSMSLVVLKDESRDLYHAVLAVSTTKGTYILDNIRNTILSDKALAHYRPLFSFSENSSWIHALPVGTGQRGTARLANRVGFSDVFPGEGTM
ncbi:transglutaminase-like cysteine peptidase [uncultured Cohaesibacter sp.]|uniref:transglutaminase-like cysteine peptidase n=1 Tax=uncultured Cohaesibacter sp. TaxID=1002546 RepID=UPI0029C8986C|nr:transglutaminase-like cysteine peptidase [uncultured Cohaesibacter sp.]